MAWTEAARKAASAARRRGIRRGAYTAQDWKDSPHSVLKGIQKSVKSLGSKMSVRASRRFGDQMFSVSVGKRRFSVLNEGFPGQIRAAVNRGLRGTKFSVGESRMRGTGGDTHVFFARKR